MIEERKRKREREREGVDTRTPYFMYACGVPRNTSHIRTFAHHTVRDGAELIRTTNLLITHERAILRWESDGRKEKRG